MFNTNMRRYQSPDHLTGARMQGHQSHCLWIWRWLSAWCLIHFTAQGRPRSGYIVPTVAQTETWIRWGRMIRVSCGNGHQWSYYALFLLDWSLASSGSNVFEPTPAPDLHGVAGCAN